LTPRNGEWIGEDGVVGLSIGEMAGQVVVVPGSSQHSGDERQLLPGSRIKAKSRPVGDPGQRGVNGLKLRHRFPLWIGF
jgi:hypothetical protein